MAVRESMLKLIYLVRSLIADQTHFRDDEIQDMLDAHRHLARFERLTAHETPKSTGVEYLDFVSKPYFEDGAVLQNNLYETLIAASADYRNGKYTFTMDVGVAVFITGTRYDVYGAAAELAEQWAGSLSAAVDFTADGASFSLSQQRKNLRELAARLRSKSEAGAARSVRMERSDTL